MTIRPPSQVMRPEVMGAFFPTRLSFSRALVRRMRRENWRIERARFALNRRGCGDAVYRVRTPAGIFSLAAFSREIAAAERSDRVIAEKWDATFVLCEGEIDDLPRLRRNAPQQEGGRYHPRDLVVSRANKSVRLFAEAAAALARGEQPDRAALLRVGYLMRTTAVYGNGKFGAADIGKLRRAPSLAPPFRAEMLTVYLIRLFTFDLIEHIARADNPAAARLAPQSKRMLGVGNATGLGMAPFLIHHPRLLHRWIKARETAIARVCAQPKTSAAKIKRFVSLLARARRHIAQWHTGDPIQTAANAGIIRRLDRLEAFFRRGAVGAHPWRAARRRAAGDPQTRELIHSLMLEPHPELVDDLEAEMDDPDGEELRGDPAQSVGALKADLRRRYRPLAARPGGYYFWYRSREKEEPRLGVRGRDGGARREMPIGIARQAARLSAALAAARDDMTAAEFALAHPRLRDILVRAQAAAEFPYGEIGADILARDFKPLDLLRCKLSFFGAAKFDPQSDRWLRVNFFQGAPLPDELGAADADDWGLPAF